MNKIIYIIFLSVSVFTTNLFGLEELIKLEDYFDSFTTNNAKWERTAGYNLNEKLGVLEARATNDSVHWLDHPIKGEVSIEFFMSMPYLNAMAGFCLSDEGGNIVYNFFHTGVDYPVELENEVYTGFSSVTADQTEFMYASKLDLYSKGWQHIKLKRKFDKLSIYLNGEFIYEAEVISEKLEFGFWSKGKGKVLFDQLRIQKEDVFSNDFSSIEPYTLPHISKKWNIESGLWKRVYIPSLKKVVLSQNKNTYSEIVLNKPVKGEYTLSSKFQFKQNGRLGFILNKKSDYSILIQLSTNEKEGVQFYKKNKNGKKLLISKHCAFYPNFWYQIKIEYTGWSYKTYIDDVFLFELPVGRDEVGQIGLFTDSQHLCLFDEIKVLKSQRKETFKAIEKLSPQHFTESDWLMERNFRSHPKSNSNQLSFSEKIYSSGYLKTQIKIGENFKRFFVNLSSLQFDGQINYILYENFIHLLVLSSKKPDAFDPRISKLSDPLSDIYKDKRNEKFFPIYYKKVFRFNKNDTKKFSLLNLGVNKGWEIYIEEMPYYRITNAEDESYYVEIGSSGEVLLENFKLSSLKESDLLDQFEIMNKFEVLGGNWSWSGFTYDQQSLGLSKRVQYKPLLFGNFDLIHDFAALKLKDHFELELASIHEQKSLIISYQCLKEDSLTVQVKLDKKEIANQDFDKGHRFLSKIHKVGEYIKVSIDEEFLTKTEMLLREPYRLSFKRTNGKFKIHNTKLFLHPDKYISFTSPDTFLDDAFNWLGKESIFVKRKGSDLSEVFVAGLKSSDLPLTLKRDIPGRFTFSVQLDYSEAKDMTHLIQFKSESSLLKFSIVPIEQGCYIDFSNDKKKVFKNLVTQKKFQFTTIFNENLCEVYIDGNIFQSFKLKDIAENLKFQMQALKGEEDSYVGFSDFCLYFNQ